MEKSRQNPLFLPLCISPPSFYEWERKRGEDIATSRNYGLQVNAGFADEVEPKKRDEIRHCRDEYSTGATHFPSFVCFDSVVPLFDNPNFFFDIHSYFFQF